jgi:hypothetical protein
MEGDRHAQAVAASCADVAAGKRQALICGAA